MLKVQLSIPDLKAQVLALRQMAQDPMAASVNSELQAEAELTRTPVLNGAPQAHPGASRARTSTPLPPTWTGGLSYNLT